MPKYGHLLLSYRMYAHMFIHMFIHLRVHMSMHSPVHASAHHSTQMYAPMCIYRQHATLC